MLRGRTPPSLSLLLALLALLAGVAFASPPPAFAAATVLRWTATGDDGTNGCATRYDLRRSTQPITAGNFAAADTVGGLPAPAASGTPQSCTVVLPTDGVPFYFALRVVDEAGNWSPISNVTVFTAPVLDAGDPGMRDLALAAPWPNPARERARVRLALPAAGRADVAVFDAAGRRVRTLWSGALEAGVHALEWDLRDARGGRAAAGIYFARAACATGTRVQRLVVTR